MSSSPTGERRLSRIGLVVTVAVHFGVGLTAWGMSVIDRAHAESRAAMVEAPMHIEAGLAIRSSSAAGKRSHLPQKDLSPRPQTKTAPGIAMDPEAKPQAPKDDAKSEDFDPESVFSKHRRPAEQDGTRAGADGANDENRAGSADGSEFGTIEDVKGDPYVGELVGRMTTNPEMTVPSVVSGVGLSTLGCVMLDEDGRIVDRAVPNEYKSAERTFNRAVEERLRITTDMDDPVPARLTERLVGKWLCVPFTY